VVSVSNGRAAMADRNIIGRAINYTGMISVSAGIFLFTFALVFILLRRGFEIEIPNPLHFVW
jgi:hypothetical protein